MTVREYIISMLGKIKAEIDNVTGDKINLKTENKNNLVEAINEVSSKLEDNKKGIDETNNSIINLEDCKLDKSENAVSASKLATPRNIALTGNVTGSANFDGSGNITINTSGISSIPTSTVSALFN